MYSFTVELFLDLNDGVSNGLVSNIRYSCSGFMTVNKRFLDTFFLQNLVQNLNKNTVFVHIKISTFMLNYNFRHPLNMLNIQYNILWYVRSVRIRHIIALKLAIPNITNTNIQFRQNWLNIECNVVQYSIRLKTGLN